MFDNLVNTLINGIFDIITSFIDIILTPVNLFIENLFPSLTIYLANFNSMLSQYVVPFVSYWFNMLPPLTKAGVIVWWTFTISYYAIVWAYSLFIKTFNVIQRIKIW